MHQSRFFTTACLIVLTFLIASFVAHAAADQGQINVVTSFDYPGTGNSTTPFGINAQGDIAGDFIDASGVRRGFVRYSNGTFSVPIVDPSDGGNFTRARGINRLGTIV